MNLRGDRGSRAVGTKLTVGKKIGWESTAPQGKRAGLTAYVLSEREIDRLEPAQLHAERGRGKEKAVGGTGALGGSRGGGPASPFGCSSIEVHLLESLPLLAVRICFPLPPAGRGAPVCPLQVASAVRKSIPTAPVRPSLYAPCILSCFGSPNLLPSATFHICLLCLCSWMEWCVYSALNTVSVLLCMLYIIGLSHSHIWRLMPACDWVVIFFDRYITQSTRIFL
jgi:hypothetical protein